MQELFNRIVDLAPAARATMLDIACGSDKQLKTEVQSLLSALERAGDFLADPTISSGQSELFEKLAPGKKIGPYLLADPIGEGGTGTVFRARQEQPLRRWVALKVIKPGMDMRQVVARFERERESLARMNHPNIAGVLDAGATPGGRPYFVMELVDGKPITDFCREGGLDLLARLKLFQTVCMAVQHAHSKGIIHRDLKPGNVLVTRVDRAATPKVIDFGIAKALSGEENLDPRMTMLDQTQLLGTPLYMSPEQAAGRHDKLDVRTDVYSLGAILYEMLTDAAPFDAEGWKSLTMTRIQQILLEEDPPRPSLRALRRLPRNLDSIVMKAMEKSADRRYESAEALAADVGRFLADEPIGRGHRAGSIAPGNSSGDIRPTSFPWRWA